MSTFFVAAVLVAIVAALILLLVSLDKKQKRNAMNQLLQVFSQKGSEQDLNFSSQEILNDTIIGLDGVHRKLLVLERWEETAFSSVVIDLKEVRSCSVKKEYGTIGGGSLKVNQLEHFLQKITLHFLLDGKPSVEVVFYDHIKNHLYEISELEGKAKHWEAILSKMIAPVKKIA